MTLPIQTLETIPAHWCWMKLKHVASLKSGESITSDSINDAWDYPVFGGDGIRGYTDAYTHSGRYVLIGRQGALCGNINYASGDFWASEHAVVVAIKGDYEINWLGQLLRSMNLNQYSQAAAQPGIAVEVVANLAIPVPPRHEQSIIANYLDRETAHIDALVAEKERMLGLLEETRAVLISRAVTRGLNPAACLKPSGLDWLGDIPAHWGTPPVYARFEVQLGKMLDEKKIKGKHLASYLRNVDVQWGKINILNLPEMDFDEEDRMRYSLEPGDILVCEGGEIGRSAIWNGEIGECYYQKALHRLRSLNGVDDASFFIFVMRALVELCVFSSQALAATIQHLPAEKLRNIRFPSPPFFEQRAIVSFLDKETIRIDEIRYEIGESIQLLKERRAALITAAVTGKIPVEEMRGQDGRGAGESNV